MSVFVVFEVGGGGCCRVIVRWGWLMVNNPSCKRNWLIHQRLKISLVLFHMVYPLIQMLSRGKLNQCPRKIFAAMLRSLSSRLKYLGLWTSLSILFIATRTFS